MKKLVLALVFLLIAIPSFAQQSPELYFEFDGYWLPDLDAAKIGPNNFTRLQNLRPTEKGIEGIQGFTKITNTAATVYPVFESGFHYKKDNPQESHVFMWGKESASEVTGGVYRFDVSVPDTGNFEGVEAVHDDATGGDLGRFSSAPADHMAYANGAETLIWGGNETQAAAFIVDTATVTHYTHDPRDYTQAIRNTLDDSANVAYVGGQNDDHVKLLLHFDGADAATSTSNLATGTTETHTITFNNSAQLDTDQIKFGISSVLMAKATDDYLSVGDSVDWCFMNGADGAVTDFTVEAWVNFPSVSTGERHTVAGQYVDANNRWSLYYDETLRSLYFVALSGGAFEVNTGVTFDPSANQWYHVFVGRSGNTFYIGADGTSGASEDPSTLTDLASSLLIGTGAAAVATWDFGGHLDEFRISKGICRWTPEDSSYTPPSRQYSTSGKTLIVGFPRPFSGVSITVKDINPQSGQTVTWTVWNGESWTEVHSSGTTENTQGLAQSGTITWSDTASFSKQRYFEEKSLHWAQGTLSDGEATISHLSVISPIQDIVDAWDGVNRSIISFQKYDGSEYEDLTLEALTADYYTVNMASMGSDEYIEIMSSERLQALYFEMSSPNTASMSTSGGVSVYYFNSEGDAAAAAVYDGTSDLTELKPFNQSGAIVWKNPDPEEEFVQLKFGEEGYVYKLQWDGTLSSGVSIEAVYGIPAPLELDPAKFTAHYKGRLLRCGFIKNNQGNRVDYTVDDAPDVWNGSESSMNGDQSLFFGSGGDLTAGIELFNRYASDLFSVFVAFMSTKTFLLKGSGPDDYQIHTVSESIGCPAPLSLAKAEVGYETVSREIKRNTIFWLSYNGPYSFDGSFPQPIEGLNTYFDPNHDNYVGRENIEDATGWYYPTYQEYNLIVGDKWFVYNLLKKKWYERHVGTAPLPVAGVHTTDSYGSSYIYSGTTIGHILRLDNGHTWDGHAIEQIVETGDFVIDPWDETIIRRIKIENEVITEAANVDIVYFKECSTSGTTFNPVPLNSGSHRIENHNITTDKLGSARRHRFKFIASTSGTTEGFQPIGWGVQWYKARDEDN